MVISYFNNIKGVISEYLEESQDFIAVCVAWLTDPDIVDILCERAERGVSVVLILPYDEINAKYNKDHERLIECGGDVFWCDHHHKFCIIDSETLITGSYNWTIAAHNRGNGENILVLRDEEEVIDGFSTTFLDLLDGSSKFDEISDEEDDEDDEYEDDEEYDEDDEDDEDEEDDEDYDEDNEDDEYEDDEYEDDEEYDEDEEDDEDYDEDDEDDDEEPDYYKNLPPTIDFYNRIFGNR